MPGLWQKKEQGGPAKRTSFWIFWDHSSTSWSLTIPPSWWSITKHRRGRRLRFYFGGLPGNLQSEQQHCRKLVQRRTLVNIFYRDSDLRKIWKWIRFLTQTHFVLNDVDQWFICFNITSVCWELIYLCKELRLLFLCLYWVLAVTEQCFPWSSCERS